MEDKEINSFVKLKVIDGGSAVKAEKQPDGTILFFDEYGNLTKDTLVQMDVYNVNQRGKKKRITTEYVTQGSLDHLRGHIEHDYVFACDTVWHHRVSAYLQINGYSVYVNKESISPTYTMK